ncbi:hypothetical protein ACIBK9_45985 [Nonomuraea sp. NPDC050227]|uniref:hypothetical protein n=1 Tax=Nonomuraea sp. NPDC050227 TaxID=3364360 RepID=UPI003789807C
MKDGAALGPGRSNSIARDRQFRAASPFPAAWRLPVASPLSVARRLPVASRFRVT